MEYKYAENATLQEYIYYSSYEWQLRKCRFENNNSAYQCYLSVGFHKSKDIADSFEDIQGEKWKIIELEISKEEFMS